MNNQNKFTEEAMIDLGKQSRELRLRLNVSTYAVMQAGVGTLVSKRYEDGKNTTIRNLMKYLKILDLDLAAVDDEGNIKILVKL